MKLLVTGTAGFIGFHTAKRLLERGDEVIGLDNVNDYYCRQSNDVMNRGGRDRGPFRKGRPFTATESRTSSRKQQEKSIRLELLGRALPHACAPSR